MVMADYNDRDRGRRRRRRGGRRDEYERSPVVLPNRPTILTKTGVDKNDQDADVDVVNNHHEMEPPSHKLPPMTLYQAEHSASSSSSSSTPAIIIKPRDKSLLSPGGLAKSPQSNSTGSSALYHPEGSAKPGYTTIQQRSTPAPTTMSEGSSHLRLAPPLEMAQSVKLIDDAFNWLDPSTDCLMDQLNYVVVGMVGAQGVGKSTLLSYLAGQTASDSRRLVFRPQGRDIRESSSHQTAGVDMYVSSDRFILLDSQPLLSASVLDHHIYQEKKHSADYTTVENAVEMQALQLMAFMLTVCHVVVVTMDWFADPNILKLVKTAEMLKPATPGHDGTAGEDYNPQIVFVVNKAASEEFSAESYSSMQQVLETVYSSSQLSFRGGVRLGASAHMPCLPKGRGQMAGDVNLFLLPQKESIDKDDEGVTSLMPEYRGHPGFDTLLLALRRQLYGVARHSLTHTPLSEKNWFHYAARTWDALKKSQLLAEYNRYLP